MASRPAAFAATSPAARVPGTPVVTLADPCVSMAGKRITQPGFPVFVIDREGYRRGINSAETYKRIFRNWDGIRSDYPLELCPERAPLSLDAQLITVKDRPVRVCSDGECQSRNPENARVVRLGVWREGRDRALEFFCRLPYA